jgi:hypothetical protein
MPFAPDVSGAAALTIVESLLLALNDRKGRPEQEILGILTDAALAHSNMPEANRKTGVSCRRRDADEWDSGRWEFGPAALNSFAATPF